MKKVVMSLIPFRVLVIVGEAVASRSSAFGGR